MRLILSCVLLLLLVGIVSAQNVTTAYAPLYAMQPAAHFKGINITFAGDSTWTVKSSANKTVKAKGVSVADSSAGGTLVVHLVNDPDTTWCIQKLSASDRLGFIFDKVHQRSTISLKDLIIWE